MDVRDYLKVLRKRWPVIVLCLVLGIGAAVGLVVSSNKVYTASAQVFVAASADADTAALNSGNTFAQSRVQSYTSVAKSPDVTQPVIDKLRLGLTSEELANKISADAPLNKVIVNLHVTDSDAAESATLANAVAAQFVIYVEKIEQISAGSQSSPVKLTVIQPALVPTSATSPKTKLDLIVGALAGLLVGLALAALREALDTRVRSVDDLVEISEASVLSVVPVDKTVLTTPVAVRGDARSPRAEAYRRLRTNLQYIDVDSPPKLIAITSAVSSEGKTSTSINLAAAMAEAGLTVCLVDADLRRPNVARTLGLVPGAGLTSILAGKATITDVLQSVGPNMSVITSGPIPPNPSELLASAQFKAVLTTLGTQVDFVVVDTAPLLPVADGSEVASVADVSLLVVRSGSTTREQVRHAVESLERVGARLGGIVLSMTAARSAGGYYYEYYQSTEPTPSVAAVPTGGGRRRRNRPEAQHSNERPPAETLEPTNILGGNRSE